MVQPITVDIGMALSGRRIKTVDFKTLNGKLETALDIIMEHFAETEDRMAELEEEVVALRRELHEETSRQR